LPPKILFVDVVVARVAGHAVVLCRLAQQATRLPLPGERLVESAERLDADEVPEDEHVQRDLELELLLDLYGRVRGLARLVVPDDPARGHRVEVDAVDLPGKMEGLQVEAALQLGHRPLGTERD